jgi:Tfp pilus assembly protein FimT
MPYQNELCYYFPMKCLAHTAAFTLAELLIVISIVTLMTGMMLPGFTNYIRTQEVRQAQEQVKNDLRTVQNRALAGVDLQAGASYWGISFSSGLSTYTLLASEDSSCASPLRMQTSEELPGGSTVVGDTCILFDATNGDAHLEGGASCQPSTCFVSVEDESGESCERVEVNSAGLIRKSACP